MDLITLTLSIKIILNNTKVKMSTTKISLFLDTFFAIFPVIPYELKSGNHWDD